MEKHEIGRLARRLFLLAVLLAALAAVSKLDRPVLAAAFETCADGCRREYVFCRDHPDGIYYNADGENNCSDFPGLTICQNFDCPTPYQFKFSQCIENPTLPGCDPAPSDPTGCPSAYADGCLSECQSEAASCPHGGHCTGASLMNPSCTCSYMVYCNP